MVWVEALTFATDEAMSSPAAYHPSILYDWHGDVPRCKPTATWMGSVSPSPSIAMRQGRHGARRLLP